MPETEQTQQTPQSTSPDATETPAEQTVLEWDGKAFDPEHARRTLQAAQEEARKARADLADFKKAQDRAKLDEVDRLKAEMAELQAKALEAEERAAAETARASITRQAAKLGFADPEDAYRLIDLAEAGEDIEGALKRLAEAKPYLTKSTGSAGHERGTQAATVTTSAANHASGGKRLTLAEVEKMTPAERHARRDDVREFLRTYKR